MAYPSDIGQDLARARRARGLSQRALGEMVGVLQPQIARWESTGYRTASLERVDTVARALGVQTAPPVAAEAPAAYTTVPRGVESVLARLHVTLEALASFCRESKIAELAFFGSVLRASFEPESDVDVLVRYQDGFRPGIGEVVEIQQGLERLLGHEVDLVERSSVERSENYIRRRRILTSAKTVYVA